MLYQLSYAHHKKAFLNYQNQGFFSIVFISMGLRLFSFALTLRGCLTIILGNNNIFKRERYMNALLIFVVRLILSLVFGIVLIRVFRPEWEIFHGVGAGFILLALSYGMVFLRKKK